MSRLPPELLVLAAVLLVVAGIAGYASWQRVPPRLDPWAELDVREEPVPVVTKMKLARLQSERRLCDAALATAGLRVVRVANHQSAKACPLEDVIYVAPENRLFSSPFHASCPLVVSLAMFVRHTLQPAARAHLGSEIARIEHVGTYSCRAVRGTPRRAAATGGAGSGEADAPGARPMSQHASANAIDITGFVTRDGRRIRVDRHWKKTSNVVPAAATGGSADTATQIEGPEEIPEARFLREVRDGACDVFHTVLGPDFNAAHRTHFHFDMGRHKVCR